MIEALCDHLSEKPGLYLDEMAIFLWDEFHTLVTASSTGRSLVAKGWSKKILGSKLGSETPTCENVICTIYRTSSYHLVYVDESRCDKRVGFRRTGWSPLGVAPM
jgi:hypothetical protein